MEDDLLAARLGPPCGMYFRLGTCLSIQNTFIYWLGVSVYIHIDIHICIYIYIDLYIYMCMRNAYIYIYM